MSRRAKVILILVLFLLALFLLWWLLRKEEPAPSPRAREAPAAEVKKEEVSLVAPLVVRESADEEEAGAIAVARMFAERYASFSSESDFANVKDLFPLMTLSLREREEARIRAAGSGGEYLGITSSVVTMSTITMNENEAMIEAGLQRRVTEGEARTEETRYETLRLQLLKENGSWFVTEVGWVQ
jgi:vacuolar-type H+-ATPase catalytic subunit A/Vma1